MFKKCTECGKIFAVNVPNRKTCSEECAEIRRRKYIDELNAKSREATRERLGTRLCVTCGREFAPDRPARVCCSPGCQKVRDRELVKASLKKTKERERAIKNSEKQIVDINAKAKEMGMSYGQYVAYIEGKKLWNGSQRKTDH